MPEPRFRRRTLLRRARPAAAGCRPEPPRVGAGADAGQGLPQRHRARRLLGEREVRRRARLLGRHATAARAAAARIAAPAWFTAGWPAQPLDGELWAGRGRFDAAQSTVGRDAPDDEAWRGMRYMVFDLPRIRALRRAHSRRCCELAARISACPGCSRSSSARWPTAPRCMAPAEEDRQARGGEGLMLHRGGSLYRGRAQRRSAQAQALRGRRGHRRRPRCRARAGTPAGSARCWSQTPDGLRFSLGSGLTDAAAARSAAGRQQVTYRYVGLHAGGVPRFASFLHVRLTEAP